MVTITIIYVCSFTTLEELRKVTVLANAELLGGGKARVLNILASDGVDYRYGKPNKNLPFYSSGAAGRELGSIKNLSDCTLV